ncbi:hypothetical protein BD410DRAFT_901803 [Rickenella mellea]|uniref:Exonuclease domain-containing protein n=1 Tax=Rickenella mellea TaxID=50990 RepID=A0A4Y7PN49_9AGAM|nr:hypothetical protein BD410DRAFT_901803 [Rickenella mellea]
MKRGPQTSPSSSSATPTSQPKKKAKLSSSSPARPSSDSTAANVIPKPSTITSPQPTLASSPPTTEANGTSDGWTKVEKRKSKKARKADAKLTNAPPRFLYVNSEIVKRKEAVTISDIRDLVLHLLGDASPQPWLRVENPRAIAKVVTLFVPGITPDILALPPLPTSATANSNVPIAIPLPPQAQPKSTSDESGHPSESPSLPFISAKFSHACPTRAPGDANKMHSILSAFFHGPVSAEEKRRRALAISEQGASSTAKNDSGPESYVLTPEQMLENEYPVPRYMADVFEMQDGWVETPESSSTTTTTTERAKVYAIDCEMCQTENGKELARVCMIDFDTDLVVLDQLVKPSAPIVDYLTRWSGITEQALQGVTTTLSDVQNSIFRLLSPTSTTKTPILLGHSLESDLHALKLAHPRCIDTALLYHHPRGRPLKPGLAWLTKRWCNREIQMGGEGGHDPEEDARACVELLRLKIKNGPGFGEFKTDHESIFERLSRSSSSPQPKRTAVVDRGNPSTWHGAKASATVACADDGEVLKGLVETIPGHDFVFGRFMGVADVLGWTTPKTSSTDPSLAKPPPPPPPSPATLSAAYKTLNTHLSALLSTLPPHTALVIFTGHSDPRPMSQLNARKSVWENEMKKGKKAEEVDREMWWSAGDARRLEEEVERAKRGLVFLCLTE